MQSKDWKNTQFGPIEDWPLSLLSMVSLVMSSSSPMALWWGPKHLLIYNDGFIPIADGRHPSSFGEPAEKYWDDDWARMGLIFDRVTEGESISLEDECITVRRDDNLEVIHEKMSLLIGGNIFDLVLHPMERRKW